MTGGHGDRPAGGVDPWTVDRLFDRELSEAERRAVIAAAARDPEAARELASTSDAIRRLREMPPAPDVSERVLDRVHTRRGFVGRRRRRRARQQRLAMAAVLVMALGSVAVLHRLAPETARNPSQPRPAEPVAELERAVRDAPRAMAQTLKDATRAASSAAFAPRETSIAGSIDDSSVRDRYTMTAATPAPSSRVRDVSSDAGRAMMNASFAAHAFDPAATVVPTAWPAQDILDLLASVEKREAGIGLPEFAGTDGEAIGLPPIIRLDDVLTAQQTGPDGTPPVPSRVSSSEAAKR